MIKLFLFLIVIFFPTIVFCQIKDTAPYKYNNSFITVPDSFPHVYLKEITIYPSFKQMTPKQQRQYSVLEKRVRKVYPMAKVAAIKVAEYNQMYLSFKTERERKDYIKKIEKDLFTEFEDQIRHMSVSEGRILIKLIDRETGKSSFEIIKEFKGGFNAFFWQTVARLFGHDLKSAYDADNEDKMIEYIVMQIDTGAIN
jgi:hypothetical protein